MTRYLFIGCMMAIMFVVTSCTLKPFGIIYNNSGYDIFIVAGDNNYHLRNAESVKILFPDLVDKFTVIKEKLELEYRVKYPPSNYVEHKLVEDLYLLQIEKDGSIYVLKPKTSMPTDILGIQPNEFPLKPGN